MIVFLIITNVELGYLIIKITELIRTIKISNDLKEYEIVNKKG